MKDVGQEKRSLKEELAEAGKEPMTLKDRIIGLLLGIALVALAICTWLWPDLIGESGADPSGRRGRQLLFILRLIWSRPAGTIAGVIGLLAIYGSLSKRSSPEGQA